MNRSIILIILMGNALFTLAQNTTKLMGEQGQTVDSMIFRISEIEVYPEYLQDYLGFAIKVGAESVSKEPGVVCIFPMQLKEDSCQIRIVEIYADQEAYRHHIQTDHFQTYKQGTLHMVKSLRLVDNYCLAPHNIPLVFRKTPLREWIKVEGAHYRGDFYMHGEGMTPEGQKFKFRLGAGARNDWHIHPGARQTLVVISGVAACQVKGEPVRHLLPGEKITFEADAIHWNGASDDSECVCYTVSELPPPGKAHVEWME